MAVSPRLIRRRIKSIGNTKKITKAMELVAASKMRRAVAAALSSRRYSSAGWEMIASLASRTDRTMHPLLAEREAKRVLVILLTSHRGLAGGFNANIIKKVIAFVKNPKEIPGASANTEVAFVTVGRKGEDAIRRMNGNIVASFAAMADTPTFADVTPISALSRVEFEKGKYDRVFIAYTDFVSALLQKPKIRQLLPIQIADIEEAVKSASKSFIEDTKMDADDTLFEPSMRQVLEAILPRMTDVQLYQAMLESSASEHSSRMMAMRSASDAAADMIGDLSFSLNQARQAAITQEISEIAAGKATLEA